MPARAAKGVGAVLRFEIDEADPFFDDKEGILDAQARNPRRRTRARTSVRPSFFASRPAM